MVDNIKFGSIVNVLGEDYKILGKVTKNTLLVEKVESGNLFEFPVSLILEATNKN